MASALRLFFFSYGDPAGCGGMREIEMGFVHKSRQRVLVEGSEGLFPVVNLNSSMALFRLSFLSVFLE